jgi:hypothetical protein
MAARVGGLFQMTWALAPELAGVAVRRQRDHAASTASQISSSCATCMRTSTSMDSIARCASRNGSSRVSGLNRNYHIPVSNAAVATPE